MVDRGFLRMAVRRVPGMSDWKKIGQRVKCVRGAPEYIGRCGWISSIGCRGHGHENIVYRCSMGHSTLLDGEPSALCGRWYNIEPVLDLPEVEALETVDAISPLTGKLQEA